MSDLQSQGHDPNSSRYRIQSYILGAMLVLLLIAVLRLFAPFFTFLLWSILLYVIVNPLYRRVIRNIDEKTFRGMVLHKFWALAFTIVTMALIYVPVFLVMMAFIRQAMGMVQGLMEVVTQRPEFLSDIYGWLADAIRSISFDQIVVTADEIDRYVRDFLLRQRNNILGLGTNIVINIGTFSLAMIIYTLIMVFSLFFLFSDGPYLSRLFLHAIPIRNEYMPTLTAKFQDITRNLFLGYIMVALTQSILAFVLFTIFKINGTLVFAVITFILVFIPMIGPLTIWLPLGIIMIAGGDIGRGILFMSLCAIFISGTENILRPIFLKDRIKLHPLIILFSILGGLVVFGFNGLILGPMLVIFFLTVLDLFLTEHRINQQDGPSAEG
ncbi:MAG: AI-2E family transporter [Treponema sp.]|nr:AI-2E family transporter [Treponema sp.]